MSAEQGPDPWEGYTNGHDKRRRLEVIPVSTMRARKAEWLWADRVPVAAFGLLAGREGLGKTQAWCWMAAAVTTGTLPGAHYGTPRAVLVVATEDDWERVLVPRLMAAGADLDLVHVIVAKSEAGAEAEVSLPLDVDALQEVVEETGAALVILDPLLSRLSEGLDTHKDAEVRLALEPLTRMARETGSTVLGLIHVSKRAVDYLSDSIMASRAFNAVSRFSLFCAYLEDDDRVMGLEKNSYGPREWCWTYEVEPATVQDPDGEDIPTSRVAWGEERHVYIGDLVREEAGRTTQTEATRWLREYLTDRGGSAAHGAIVGANKADDGPGYSMGQLRTARRTLDVEVVRTGYQGGSEWKMPEDAWGSIPATPRGETQE